MRRMLMLAAAAAMLPACERANRQDSPEASQEATAADEQAIGETNERWLALVRSKDAAGIANLYAEDGALLAPNAPIALGRQAVQQGWQSMMDLPDFQLTFQPDEIVISRSGDMAMDRGTYRFSANPPAGPVQDSGKYVVVWRKIAGEWKVAADIFNSDRPAA